MRLKRLKIHNIASIVDGVVDFEGDVLGGEPIFLICGKTGSGKTTLLDAICLALYNDTPRMRQSPNERYYEEGGKEQRVESSVGDVRQLMRRNTGEASVRLVFEGNDGNDYEALWSVRRARQSERHPAGRGMVDKKVQERKGDGEEERGGAEDKGSGGTDVRPVLPFGNAASGRVHPLPQRQGRGEGGDIGDHHRTEHIHGDREGDI